MKNEIWRDIKGYEGKYQISNYARIRNLNYHRMKYTKILSIWVDKRYDRVCLWKNNISNIFSVHRLVLETFIGSCPEGKEACHNNGRRTDNRVENLRWDTRKNNHEDKKKHGTMACGEKINMAKLIKKNVI